MCPFSAVRRHRARNFRGAADNDTTATDGIAKILDGAAYTFTVRYGSKLMTAEEGKSYKEPQRTGHCSSGKSSIRMKLCRIVPTNDTSLALTVEDVSLTSGSNIGVAAYTGSERQQFQIHWD